MSDTRPQIKTWIEGIHAYVPGKATGAQGQALIKLSANENPLGCSPKALEALDAPGNPATYPDPDAKALRAKLAEVHGLDAGRIVCGTGSDELLNLAAQAFAGPGDEVLFSTYSFSVYDIAARRCGATPVEAPDADYAADVDALLAAVTDKTRVVFVANPNNPTGSFLPRDEIARLHAGLPQDVLFVLDQAYAEYLTPEEDDGGFALAAAHENVLVTRTFSKAYGLAGERIGWATGAPHFIDALNRVRGPFNVTNSGQAAALAGVDDQNFIDRTRDHNTRELTRFTDAMAALGNHGIRPLPSKANFALVLFEGTLAAETALSALADAGYAVRHLPGQGLPHGLRITIGTAEDMDRIARTIAEAAEAAQ
ncbi:histidinol-phosphate transaminase [Erythrobacter litoralis]|uniref:Histidinol-phosphate aminotransferase n=1 Tax=Erythrobacter litoralis (strain HTCC2594) TaxID=314225 RepID=HIS8_ERYLH|nr:histidinol-phosphate transaminase [Erythrobacter litoralis]Q2N7G6.1 RecName: Full=Histidinol-phosphate aminotransferase; AltName: Full=Imidazole acetol-phosphate transaminase [Erythrobacter litoralis HTCC2594]ABC64375.1 histidinol-phosphate aminotransferase [Erythrobacter litoralis HTCC2594]